VEKCKNQVRKKNFKIEKKLVLEWFLGHL
jgi:hypothetical protein